MTKKNHTLLERALNTALNPLAVSYGYIKNILRRTKEEIPFLYDEIESLVKSHLVTLEKDRELMHEPDLDSFSRIITSNIIRRLPNINEQQLYEMVKDRSSKSFLDMVGRGLGAVESEKDYTIIERAKLFKRLLIANRGEIALRIIRACKELGIGTAIVYAKPDKETLGVRFADKSYLINGANPYLNTGKIISIAKKFKADAVHPGYGFLAENASFAKECEKNKIKFIGPSSRAIRAMGDKIAARNSIISAGIPVIPGTSEGLRDEHHALGVAKELGYPIILKASSGGGGKGMRIIRSKKELKKGFQAAQAEAMASFGDKTLYLEKYFEEPRHIEFQILADRYGNAIHLGERDCTIQRRHQKLIEEAPSPALTNRLRKQMGEVAVKAAKLVGYEGAGTVEFLLDEHKRFFFMEMNTRIQVEHGVTEMVTGIDLIKEQIKLAAGARLAYRQRDIKIHGCAIECRINAEDPSRNFEPSTGVIASYLPPGGPGIRVCSSAHAGHEVTGHYDPLLAKLMCFGRNRHEAISRMKRALAEFIIEGVSTTMPFHQAVLNNKNFLKGNITTSFIEQNRIAEELKKPKIRKKELTQEDKILIVTTAVSQYYQNKNNVNNHNNWTLAARQEAINQESF